MAILSSLLRLCVEGKTVDGREISRQDIVDMAETYNRDTYGARVWPEHFRGLIPGGPFDALGDVFSLEAKEITDGDLAGNMALYGQVEALPKLVKYSRDRQKIFFSVEILDDFRGTGKAYLYGLAVTDSPASVGTEPHNFSMKVPGHAEYRLYSSNWHESDLEFPKPAQEPEKTEFSERIGQILNPEADEMQIKAGIEQVAQHSASLEAKINNLSDQMAELSNFKEKLVKEESKGHQKRPAASGGTDEYRADF